MKVKIEIERQNEQYQVTLNDTRHWVKDSIEDVMQLLCGEVVDVLESQDTPIPF